MLPGGEQYVVVSTGEIIDIKHGLTRKDNKRGLYKTFASIRAIINTNVVDVRNVRWATLTYAENMTDTVKLYEDFNKFIKRFKYNCELSGYGKPEYIVIMEPQGRGAWHAHLLLIWDHAAPYISNDKFAELWGHGFVTIKRLKDVDNVGAYLTAYLGDMEINEAVAAPECGLCHVVEHVVKEVEVEDHGKKVKKMFLKGARLHLYPAKFHMFRKSRGIKVPVSVMIPQEWAEKKVSAATKTFEKTVKLSDDSGFTSVINTVQYNTLRRKV
jgi:hypothetical protein